MTVDPVIPPPEDSLEQFQQHLATGLLLVADNAQGRRAVVDRFLGQGYRSSTAIQTILDRRSVARLVEPGPTEHELQVLLSAAATVPDHGRLQPWRFVVIDGAARDRFADALVAAATEHQPDLPDARVAKVRGKAFAAPTSIAVIASPRDGTNIPEWEQRASACCTAYAIVLSAYALGLGAVWKSTPFLDAAPLRRCFAMTQREQLLGWVHVGARANHVDPPRPPGRHIADLITVLAP